MPLGLECPSLAITSEPPSFGSASCPVSCAAPGFVSFGVRCPGLVCDRLFLPCPPSSRLSRSPVLLTFSRSYPRCASPHTCARHDPYFVVRLDSHLDLSLLSALTTPLASPPRSVDRPRPVSRSKLTIHPFPNSNRYCASPQGVFPFPSKHQISLSNCGCVFRHHVFPSSPHQVRVPVSHSLPLAHLFWLESRLHPERSLSPCACANTLVNCFTLEPSRSLRVSLE